MAHFPEGFGLDLSDALSRDTELTSYFLESAAITINQSKPLLQDLAFALGQRLEHVFNLLLQENDCRHVARVFRAFIFDEISEICFFAFPHGRLQGNRLLRHLEYRA